MTKVLVYLIIINAVHSANYTHGQDLKKSGKLNVNEVEIYHEVYGQGEPLFLLHGCN